MFTIIHYYLSVLYCLVFRVYHRLKIYYILFFYFCFYFPFSIGYSVVTVAYRVFDKLAYKYNQRQQRVVNKENEFYMQLLQMALPIDDSVQDELMSQLPQITETLHSDELGDIVLPISSIMAAQQMQQQQMVLATSTTTKSFKTNGGPASAISSNSAKHMLNSNNSSILTNRSVNLSSNIGNGHTINGGLSNQSTSSNSTLTIVNGGISGINHIQNSNNSSNNISTSSSTGAQLRASHRKSLDRCDRNNDNLSTMRSSNGGTANNSVKIDGQHMKRSSNMFQEANKITESITKSIWSTIWYRVFGNHRTNVNGNSSVNSMSNSTTFSLAVQRNSNHVDDDISNSMINNDTDANNTMASIISTTSSSGRGSKEIRNSNTDGTYAQTTITSNVTSKHERDNSKTSNSNYSTDINNDSTYQSNHFGNGKDKYLNKVHQQNGNVSTMEIEQNTVAQNQPETSNDGPERSRGNAT